jgi:WD40 repeat protein
MKFLTTIALLIFFQIGFTQKQNGYELILPQGHKESIDLLDLSPNGDYLISISEGFRCLLWNKHTGSLIKSFEFKIGNIADLKFKDDKSVWILFDNGSLLNYDIENEKEIYKELSKNVVNSIRIIDGNLFLYYDKKKDNPFSNLFEVKKPENIEQRELINGKLLRIAKGSSTIIKVLNNQFITIINENEIVVYDKDLSIVNTIVLNEEISDLIASSSGFIFITESNKAFVSYDLKSFHLLVELPGLNYEWKIKLSYRNNYLTFFSSKNVRIMNLSNLDEIYEFKIKILINEIIFNPDNEDELIISLEKGYIMKYNYKNMTSKIVKSHDDFNWVKIFQFNNNDVFTLSYTDILFWSLNTFKVNNTYNDEVASIRNVRHSKHNNSLLVHINTSLQKIELNNITSGKKTIFKDEIVDGISEIFEDTLFFINKRGYKTDLMEMGKFEKLFSFDINKDSLQKNFITGMNGEHRTILFNSNIIVQAANKYNSLIFKDFDNVVLGSFVVMGIRNVIHSRNHKYLMTFGNGVLLFENLNGDEIEVFAEFDNDLFYAAFSQDEDKIILVENKPNNILKIFDLKSSTIQSEIFQTNPILSVGPQNHFDFVPFVTIDTLKIFDLVNENLIVNTSHSLGVINDITWYNDTILILAGDDGRLTFYNLKKHTFDFSLLFYDDNEFLIVTKQNFYFANSQKVKTISFNKGLQTIGFDQLDIKYNRPDKVLAALGEAFGNPDTLLTKSYYHAWQKRVKKLGVDTTAFVDGFSVPESDFKNRNEIAYEQIGNQLILKVWGKDADYKLDRYNIWVNEVPIFGQRGVNIRNKKLNELNTTITITLSEGENKIESSVMNVNGIESYRIPLYVRYTSPKPSPSKIHFIGIGVDNYQQPGHDLRYAVKDIRDLVAKLKSKHGENLIVDTLFNQQVTKEKILALKQKLLNSGVNDKVIISFSGHGLLSKDFDYYLATYPVNFTNPQQGGLPYEDLEWLLDSIPPRQKLLLLDACHSGEVDKEELVAINEMEKPVGVKGVLRISYKKPELGLKNSFELMQELFANVNKGTGATIISASGGNQFAYEKSTIANGVFTYSILELMNQQEKVTVGELKEHVGARVLELTNGQQRPTSRSETLEFDWELW